MRYSSLPPTDSIEEHAVAALKTDVSVLVEKPLAHTLRARSAS